MDCRVVEHYRDDKGIGPVTTKTDAEGRFKFDHVAPGEVTLWVSRPNLGEIVGESDRVAKRVILIEDETKTTVDFDLEVERGHR